MSVIPRGRGGAGSAITNTSRQVAVALGVAVLGSILSRAYRSDLAPGLHVLPAASRAPATQSIAATESAAARLGHGGAGLMSLAERSFVHAMHVTTVFSAVIAASGAVLIAMWMPGRRARLRRTRTDRLGNLPVAVLMED
jgi:hypothetical protein